MDDRIVQLVAVNVGEIVALTESGKIYHRIRDPRDMNTGPIGGGPKYLWNRIKLPGEE